ncbi:hypothetical protein IFM89_015052 [Coptis chinensis]|uniref:ditrans,polycis-polyprenyl diphosphate synthase [(2E,6E)-farnesyldiphosphate specific] n=1 Tax=Coptis chinensis TaxID=261450 RepID=A0A835LM97_9MAGN|nr:hypothetical protein IFM89_015052 [Coptis chinensis]
MYHTNAAEPVAFLFLNNSFSLFGVRETSKESGLLKLQKASIAMLRLVWLFLHLVATIWHFVMGTAQTLQSYLISSGIVNKYKAIDLTNLQYLAIVVESQEAYDMARVVKLLHWLSKIGVKHICLYDMDGVLKKTRKFILEKLGESRLWHLEDGEKSSCLDETQRTLEFLSISDGKEGTAKAASHLCTKLWRATTQPASSLWTSEVSLRLSCMENAVYGDCTHGTIEINETWYFSENRSQVCKGAAKLRQVTCSTAA